MTMWFEAPPTWLDTPPQSDFPLLRHRRDSLPYDFSVEGNFFEWDFYWLDCDGTGVCHYRAATYGVRNGGGGEE